MIEVGMTARRVTHLMVYAVQMANTSIMPRVFYVITRLRHCFVTSDIFIFSEDYCANTLESFNHIIQVYVSQWNWQKILPFIRIQTAAREY